MAYAQWVEIKIIASRGLTVSVKNAVLAYGKFHQPGGTEVNKDVEISADVINTLTITGGTPKVIASCGRSDSPSGTEGSFDLYDGDIYIGHYYWDCPWGQKTNTSTWTASNNEQYVTEVSGANLYAGALGNITIKIGKFLDF